MTAPFRAPPLPEGDGRIVAFPRSRWTLRDYARWSGYARYLIDDADHDRLPATARGHIADVQSLAMQIYRLARRSGWCL